MSTPLAPSTVWLVVTAVAAIGLAFRLSFFLLFGRLEEIPEGVELVLRYVAPAVLPALVLPELLLSGGTVTVASPRLLAGLVAGAVAWRTENIAATVGVGMVAYWALRTIV